jgi:signal transduction histidine kinase
MAFLDVRMPPGWDGVETAKHLWEVEPDLQIVICTAFSDYTWQDTVAALGRTDRLLILKKPFDRVEVCQLASALTEKWNLVMKERASLQTAIRAEAEARAYASSLETVNRALEASWARAENELTRRSDFLLKLSTEVLAPAQLLLIEQLDRAVNPGRASADPLPLSERAMGIVSAITSVVDLAAIEAGVARAQSAPCSPWKLASDAAERARSSAPRGVEVRLQCGDSVPEAIDSDPEKIARVLDELMSNALRFTTEGSIEIRLEAVSDRGEPASLVRWSVIDSGPGLAPESSAHLFEPFATSGGTRAGLGLALGKRTAGLLGGELSCERGEDAGARFTLSVPVGSGARRA